MLCSEEPVAAELLELDAVEPSSPAEGFNGELMRPNRGSPKGLEANRLERLIANGLNERSRTLRERRVRVWDCSSTLASSD